MYPLNVDHLMLAEVARHWARDLEQHPSPDEVFGTLLKAIWAGHFEPETPSLERTNIRRAFLSVVALGNHDGIEIVCTPRPTPEVHSFTVTGDHVRVSGQHVVYLPEDEAGWSEDILQQAYRTLESCEPRDYSKGFLPGPRCARIGRKCRGVDLAFMPKDCQRITIHRPQPRRPII